MYVIIAVKSERIVMVLNHFEGVSNAFRESFLEEPEFQANATDVQTS